MSFSRREFIGTAVVGSLAVNLPAQQAAGKRPIIVCANNGYPYLDAGFEFLKSGGDTLDAALRVVKGPEDDANISSPDSVSAEPAKAFVQIPWWQQNKVE